MGSTSRQNEMWVADMAPTSQQNNAGTSGTVISMLTLWLRPGVRTGEPYLLSCALRIIAPENQPVKGKSEIFSKNNFSTGAD